MAGRRGFGLCHHDPRGATWALFMAYSSPCVCARRARQRMAAGLACLPAGLSQDGCELRRAFLGRADATFLKRILLGDVLDVDWRKLNRMDAFKMNSMARSFMIQGVPMRYTWACRFRIPSTRGMHSGSWSGMTPLSSARLCGTGPCDQADFRGGPHGGHAHRRPHLARHRREG